MGREVEKIANNLFNKANGLKRKAEMEQQTLNFLFGFGETKAAEIAEEYVQKCNSDSEVFDALATKLKEMAERFITTVQAKKNIEKAQRRAFKAIRLDLLSQPINNLNPKEFMIK